MIYLLATFCVIEFVAFAFMFILNKALMARLERACILPIELTHEVLASIEAVVNAVHQKDPDQNGEWKRHQVYARLIKDHPEIPRYVLARGIEEVVTRQRSLLSNS